MLRGGKRSVGIRALNRLRDENGEVFALPCGTGRNRVCSNNVPLPCVENIKNKVDLDAIIDQRIAVNLEKEMKHKFRNQKISFPPTHDIDKPQRGFEFVSKNNSDESGDDECFSFPDDETADSI